MSRPSIHGSPATDARADASEADPVAVTRPSTRDDVGDLPATPVATTAPVEVVSLTTRLHEMLKFIPAQGRLLVIGGAAAWAEARLPIGSWPRVWRKLPRQTVFWPDGVFRPADVVAAGKADVVVVLADLVGLLPDPVPIWRVAFDRVAPRGWFAVAYPADADPLTVVAAFQRATAGVQPYLIPWTVGMGWTVVGRLPDPVPGT
jgi:hypothetical protein